MTNIGGNDFGISAVNKISTVRRTIFRPMRLNLLKTIHRDFYFMPLPQTPFPHNDGRNVYLKKEEKTPVIIFVQSSRNSSVETISLLMF